jgi:hypothetical protein
LSKEAVIYYADFFPHSGDNLLGEEYFFFISYIEFHYTKIFKFISLFFFSAKKFLPWCTPVTPAIFESSDRKAEVQEGSGIKGDPISKRTNAKRAGSSDREPP